MNFIRWNKYVVVWNFQIPVHFHTKWNDSKLYIPVLIFDSICAIAKIWNTKKNWTELCNSHLQMILQYKIEIQISCLIDRQMFIIFVRTENIIRIDFIPQIRTEQNLICVCQVYISNLNSSTFYPPKLNDSVFRCSHLATLGHGLPSICYGNNSYINKNWLDCFSSSTTKKKHTHTQYIGIFGQCIDTHLERRTGQSNNEKTT